MRIELHCHSTCSDGSLRPALVAERAAARQVELFALTDHDTTEGYAATQAAFPAALRGVEISCVEDGHTVHVLAYEATDSAHWEVIEEALTRQREARRERALEIHRRLAELGAHFDPEVVLARPGVIGRPHIAQALVDSGAVRSLSEAFNRFLHDGGPGDVPIARLQVGQALELVQAAGARASLAHPHHLGNLAEPLLRRYKEEGLQGLEVYYGLYRSGQRRKWLELATRHGMVMTGGSDFHGDALPQITTPGVDLPEAAGRRLLEWLGRA